MRFQLTVVRARQAPHLIEIDASTVEEARQKARRDGFAVLSLRAGGWTRRLRAAFLRTNRPDPAIFIEQLRDLLLAGLSVMEALDALQRGNTGRLAPVLADLARRLREGMTLSGAMTADAVFQPLLVALVRASELTSDLAQSLTRFLEHERRVTEVRQRLAAAALYPMIVSAVGGAVMLFLMLYVMPRFARVFEGMAGELPWSARTMVAWANFLQTHSQAMCVAAASMLAALAAAFASPVARSACVDRITAFGPVRRRLETYFLTRWYRATGVLVIGGIPFPEALALSRGLLPHALRAKGELVERSVQGGLAPSAAYGLAGMATAVAGQLLLAGERTGDLGAVLARIADFHEVETSRALERAMRVMEPAVMVGIGLVVGLIVVLMYLPIFELASAIQ